MCFGTKSKPAQYTYESPPRPASPSRGTNPTHDIASASSVPANMNSAGPIPVQDPASVGNEPPTYTQSIHSNHKPSVQAQPNDSDAPIPIQRRPTDLPIPLSSLPRTDTQDLPIPVNDPAPAGANLPIPVNTPPPDSPAVSHAPSPHLSAPAPNSQSNAQEKKKKSRNWNPFSTPTQKDPSKFRSDEANPYLHAKPAVPSPAMGAAIDQHQAEQAYAHGFHDGRAGFPARQPWGLAGEHYARGYNVAAAARAQGGGLWAENGGQTAGRPMSSSLWREDMKRVGPSSIGQQQQRPQVSPQNSGAGAGSLSPQQTSTLQGTPQHPSAEMPAQGSIPIPQNSHARHESDGLQVVDGPPPKYAQSSHSIPPQTASNPQTPPAQSPPSVADAHYRNTSGAMHIPHTNHDASTLLGTGWRGDRGAQNLSAPPPGMNVPQPGDPYGSGPQPMGQPAGQYVQQQQQMGQHGEPVGSSGTGVGAGGFAPGPQGGRKGWGSYW